MRKSTIEKLCCPFDKMDLELNIVLQDTQNNILEGWLFCKECSRSYPIVRGVPIMNPDEYRELSLERPLFERWQKQLQGKKFDNFRLTKK